jgi:hypothetical protein
MRKRISAIIVAGGAAALTLGLTSAPSFATTVTKTWTVKPGGSISGKAFKSTLTDTTTGTVLTCKSSTTTATAKSGTGLPGAKIASISTLTFNTCTGPLGLTFTVASSGFPWFLNALSFTASTGVTHGTITGAHAVLTGSGCSATVDGTGATADNGMVKGTYNNGTGKLKILSSGGNLHIYNVNGCFGLVNSGDAANFTTTYAITPVQTITSP